MKLATARSVIRCQSIRKRRDAVYKKIEIRQRHHWLQPFLALPQILYQYVYKIAYDRIIRIYRQTDSKGASSYIYK